MYVSCTSIKKSTALNDQRQMNRVGSHYQKRTARGLYIFLTNLQIYDDGLTPWRAPQRDVLANFVHTKQQTRPCPRPPALQTLAPLVCAAGRVTMMCKPWVSEDVSLLSSSDSNASEYLNGLPAASITVLAVCMHDPFAINCTPCRSQILRTAPEANRLMAP